MRGLRHGYLLNCQAGQASVGFYYGVSPPVAEFTIEHPTLKPVVRVGLMLVVAISAADVKTSTVQKMTVLVLLALCATAIVFWSTRREAWSIPDAKVGH